MTWNIYRSHLARNQHHRAIFQISRVISTPKKSIMTRQRRRDGVGQMRNALYFFTLQKKKAFCAQISVIFRVKTVTMWRGDEIIKTLQIRTTTWPLNVQVTWPLFYLVLWNLFSKNQKLLISLSNEHVSSLKSFFKLKQSYQRSELNLSWGLGWA